MLFIPERVTGLVRRGIQAALIGLATFVLAQPSLAAGRDDIIVVVTEEGPATLDIHGSTANVPTHEISWNVYDRLITHAKTKLPDGTYSYDYTTFEPELAERWDVAPGNTSVTFHLRKDATFHDGRPVTAKDVKWS